MVSSAAVLLCAATAALFCTAVGYPVARVALPAGWSALATAPALGWAVFSAAALPLLLLTGFTSATVVATAATALAVSLVATRRLRLPILEDPRRPRVPLWAFALAGLAACAPAAAVVPKPVADGVILAAPAFDHAKVAIIDEIVRLGLPPGNPTFGGPGEPTRLIYYYLWHFSAAMLARPLGASGWAADVALTWFTAASSLLLMMALAVWISGRSMAATLVIPLCLVGSSRPLLVAVLGPDLVGRWLSGYPSVGGWSVQATWAPQHLAAACCVVLSVVLVAHLAHSGRRRLIPVLALTTAAGFASSTWVGGVSFALAAGPVGLALLWRLEGGARPAFLLNAAAAALLSVALVLPLLADQYAAAAAHAGGVPIALYPYEVLGPAVPEIVRRWLDLPAYWLLLLPVDLPAIYLAGVAGLVATLARADPRRERGRLVEMLALLAGASFVVSWLLISTLLSNDLGWRALLPGILVAAAAAAAALAQLLAGRRWLWAAGALGLAALGVPDGRNAIASNLAGRPSSAAAAFAWTPDLWAAVRRHAGATDRVANNPMFLADLTPWPGNLSWALLADRRSCYANWALVRPFTAMPTSQVDALEALFVRIFAGHGSPEEVRDLATSYDCRFVVLTAVDGAWQRDPFAGNAAYHLVDSAPDRWRIYAATSRQNGDQPGG